ncbi:MAG: hypothetical protein IJ437_04475 [Clostridia bacterium]|nr:hypothetical protein [Clostridia bacterium]
MGKKIFAVLLITLTLFCALILPASASGTATTTILEFNTGTSNAFVEPQDISVPKTAKVMCYKIGSSVVYTEVFTREYVDFCIEFELYGEERTLQGIWNYIKTSTSVYQMVEDGAFLEQPLTFSEFLLKENIPLSDAYASFEVQYADYINLYDLTTTGLIEENERLQRDNGIYYTVNQTLEKNVKELEKENAELQDKIVQLNGNKSDSTASIVVACVLISSVAIFAFVFLKIRRSKRK